MNYRNTEMKLDQIITYLNEGKINLSPVFQRGHVWSVGTRRKLIQNMVQGRPIPAIFLYKEAEGARYSYNILDGKQRLESLILFVGNQRPDIKIGEWHRYLFDKRHRKDVDFWIQLPEGKSKFKKLDEDTIREFREYAIPTIEISMGDETTLDEIINLFVDINQQGVAVSRFAIVKAMARKDELMKSVFRLIALEQKRGEDVFYKSKQNEFTSVLKTLTLVANIPDSNARVDRMWERLLEITVFVRTRKHRKPVEILKSFIGPRGDGHSAKRLSRDEEKALRQTFRFLRKAYQLSALRSTRLATDQTHFYTLVTTLLDGDLLTRFSEEGLMGRLVKFAQIIDGKTEIPKRGRLAKAIKKYQEVSQKQTTDVSRREIRGEKLIEAIALLDRVKN